jgi:methionyl-tRNA formyltransferase
MRVTLYLMTQKGFEVLKALIENDFQTLIAAVVIGKDKNIDHDFSDEITALCEQHHLQYMARGSDYPPSSDYAIAISWRWLIPENSTKLIVLHDSLLPKYRGFAPLVNMLINQAPVIGVSAIFAASEYDKGDLIAQSATRVTYPIKIADAIRLIAQNYIELVVHIFSTLEKGNILPAVPQDETRATYSLWRDEADYLINWQKNSEAILHFINAVSSPYKGAATFMNGVQKVRILDAALTPDVIIENRDAGKVIFINDQYPVIVCGSGLLELRKVVDDKTGTDLLPFQNFRIRFSTQ